MEFSNHNKDSKGFVKIEKYDTERTQQIAAHYEAILSLLGEDAQREEEGFYIRSGIVVILKNATIADGTVI